MAITRREFVTRLGALAAAMGVSQVDLAKITEALAHGGPWSGVGTDWTTKPKVVWVHGAECTGCSTSLLSLFEDVRGTAVEGRTESTLWALDAIAGGTGDGAKVLNASAGHDYGHRTLWNTAGAGATSLDFDNTANGTPYIANIADLLIDFIDLQYHETVMNAGGDLAYKWLEDLMVNGDASGNAPFVMVVEGAVQPGDSDGILGAWDASGTVPWCSIGQTEADDGTPAHNPVGELSFDKVVLDIAAKDNCVAIVAIGQCACFGGYPACITPVADANGSLTGDARSQTGAMGVYDFLSYLGGPSSALKDKVFNAPGCPTNPWWFVLSVVLLLTKLVDGPDLTARDKDQRIKAVYGTPLHGAYCTRYQDYQNAVFATAPGEPGCLQLLGCKGPSTMTLCGPHGWNSQQPHNDPSWELGLGTLQGARGGNCIAGGSPCMACTEKGYPDSFLPFIVRAHPNEFV